MADRLHNQLRRLAAGMRSVWVYLGVSVILSAIVAYVWPGPIAGNTFLRTFLPAEYLAALIVFVTVTLASIVTIHVKLTTMAEGDDTVSFRDQQVARLRKKTTPLHVFFSSFHWLRSQF